MRLHCRDPARPADLHASQADGAALVRQVSGTGVRKRGIQAAAQAAAARVVRQPLRQRGRQPAALDEEHAIHQVGLQAVQPPAKPEGGTQGHARVQQRGPASRGTQADGAQPRAQPLQGAHQTCREWARVRPCSDTSDARSSQYTKGGRSAHGSTSCTAQQGRAAASNVGGLQSQAAPERLADRAAVARHSRARSPRAPLRAPLQLRGASALLRGSRTWRVPAWRHRPPAVRQTGTGRRGWGVGRKGG